MEKNWTLIYDKIHLSSIGINISKETEGLVTLTIHVFQI